MNLVYGILFVVLVAVTGGGWFCALNQDRRFHPAAAAGLILGLGLASYGLIPFWISLAGFAPSRVTAALPVALAAGALVWGLRQHPRIYRRPATRRIDRLAGAGAAVIATAALAGVCTYAFAYVNFEWDAYMLWGHKARVVSTDPMRQADYFHNLHYAMLHLNYPLQAPFLMASVNGVAGDLKEILPKLVFPLSYVAYGLLLFAGVRTQVKGRPAILLVLLGFTPAAVLRWAGSGYVDVVLAMFHTGTVAALLLWSRSTSRSHAVLAAVFAAGAAFTKNEGLALLGIYAVAVVLLTAGARWRRRLPGAVLFLTAAAVLILPWLVFRQSLPQLDENYPARLELSTLLAKAGRLTVILPGILQDLFARMDWNGVWHLLVVVSVLGWRGFRRRETRFLAAVLGGHLGLYILVYTIAPAAPAKLMVGTLERLIVHVLPVAVLLIAAHWRQLKIQAGLKRRQTGDSRAASNPTPRLLPKMPKTLNIVKAGSWILLGAGVVYAGTRLTRRIRWAAKPAAFVARIDRFYLWPQYSVGMLIGKPLWPSVGCLNAILDQLGGSLVRLRRGAQGRCDIVYPW